MKTTNLLIQVCALLQVAQYADSSGVIETNFKDFVNYKGKRIDGSCCDESWGWGLSWLWGNKNDCSDECDHSFLICIGNSTQSSSMSSCELGREEIDTGGGNKIIFNSHVGKSSNPLRFQFGTWPGVVKLKIDVLDKDSDDEYDFVDHIEYQYDTLALQQEINSTEKFYELNGTRTSLNLGLKVYCDKYYYGPGCLTYCVDTDDYRGHYTCAPSTGKNICRAGWSGEHCLTNIDDCVGHRCHYGSTCVDGVNLYTCRCPPGRTGLTCEAEINECASGPCRNQGMCLDAMNGFICECRPGFSGLLCEIEIDECRSSPCLNMGICVDGTAKYTCACAPGFSGERCETDLNECLLSPCIQASTCIDLLGDYRCECVSGYTGKNCEYNINECDSNPCQNSGMCIDEIYSYRCMCQRDFVGPNCNDCDPKYCLNGGKCKVENGTIICQCQNGFTGLFCERDFNECAMNANLCGTHGKCLNMQGNYTCQCDHGYDGRHCENETDECSLLEIPCLNGGICVDDVGSYRCACTKGFTGENCSSEINECESSPCKNGGNCTDIQDGYICGCCCGFSGQHCENDINECTILAHPCLNGGNCVDLIGNYRCECRSGFTGINCSNDINECESSPCLNKGLCADMHDGYACQCSAEFSGRNCETSIVLTESTSTSLATTSSTETTDASTVSTRITVSENIHTSTQYKSEITQTDFQNMTHEDDIKIYLSTKSSTFDHNVSQNISVGLPVQTSETTDEMFVTNSTANFSTSFELQKLDTTSPLYAEMLFTNFSTPLSTKQASDIHKITDVISVTPELTREVNETKYVFTNDPNLDMNVKESSGEITITDILSGVSSGDSSGDSKNVIFYLNTTVLNITTSQTASSTAESSSGDEIQTGVTSATYTESSKTMTQTSSDNCTSVKCAWLSFVSGSSGTFSGEESEKEVSLFDTSTKLTGYSSRSMTEIFNTQSHNFYDGSADMTESSTNISKKVKTSENNITDKILDTSVDEKHRDTFYESSGDIDKVENRSANIIESSTDISKEVKTLEDITDNVFEASVDDKHRDTFYESSGDIDKVENRSANIIESSTDISKEVKTLEDITDNVFEASVDDKHRDTFYESSGDIDKVENRSANIIESSTDISKEVKTLEDITDNVFEVSVDDKHRDTFYESSGDIDKVENRSANIIESSTDISKEVKTLEDITDNVFEASVDDKHRDTFYESSGDIDKVENRSANIIESSTDISKEVKTLEDITDNVFEASVDDKHRDTFYESSGDIDKVENRSANIIESSTDISKEVKTLEDITDNVFEASVDDKHRDTFYESSGDIDKVDVTTNVYYLPGQITLKGINESSGEGSAFEKKLEQLDASVESSGEALLTSKMITQTTPSVETSGQASQESEASGMASSGDNELLATFLLTKNDSTGSDNFNYSSSEVQQNVSLVVTIEEFSGLAGASGETSEQNFLSGLKDSYNLANMSNLHSGMGTDTTQISEIEESGSGSEQESLKDVVTVSKSVSVMKTDTISEATGFTFHTTASILWKETQRQVEGDNKNATYNFTEYNIEDETLFSKTRPPKMVVPYSDSLRNGNNMKEHKAAEYENITKKTESDSQKSYNLVTSVPSVGDLIDDQNSGSGNGEEKLITESIVTKQHSLASVSIFSAEGSTDTGLDLSPSLKNISDTKMILGSREVAEKIISTATDLLENIDDIHNDKSVMSSNISTNYSSETYVITTVDHKLATTPKQRFTQSISPTLSLSHPIKTLEKDTFDLLIDEDSPLYHKLLTAQLCASSISYDHSQYNTMTNVTASASILTTGDDLLIEIGRSKTDATDKMSVSNIIHTSESVLTMYNTSSATIKDAISMDTPRFAELTTVATGILISDKSRVTESTIVIKDTTISDTSRFTEFTTVISDTTITDTSQFAESTTMIEDISITHISRIDDSSVQIGIIETKPNDTIDIESVTQHSIKFISTTLNLGVQLLPLDTKSDDHTSTKIATSTTKHRELFNPWYRAAKHLNDKKDKVKSKVNDKILLSTKLLSDITTDSTITPVTKEINQTVSTTETDNIHAHILDFTDVSSSISTSEITTLPSSAVTASIISASISTDISDTLILHASRVRNDSIDDTTIPAVRTDFLNYFTDFMHPTTLKQVFPNATPTLNILESRSASLLIVDLNNLTFPSHDQNMTNVSYIDTESSVKERVLQTYDFQQGQGLTGHETDIIDESFTTRKESSIILNVLRTISSTTNVLELSRVSKMEHVMSGNITSTSISIYHTIADIAIPTSAEMIDSEFTKTMDLALSVSNNGGYLATTKFFNETVDISADNFVTTASPSTDTSTETIALFSSYIATPLVLQTATDTLPRWTKSQLEKSTTFQQHYSFISDDNITFMNIKDTDNDETSDVFLHASTTDPMTHINISATTLHQQYVFDTVTFETWDSQMDTPKTKTAIDFTLDSSMKNDIFTMKSDVILNDTDTDILIKYSHIVTPNVSIINIATHLEHLNFTDIVQSKSRSTSDIFTAHITPTAASYFVSDVSAMTATNIEDSIIPTKDTKSMLEQLSDWDVISFTTHASAIIHQQTSLSTATASLHKTTSGSEAVIVSSSTDTNFANGFTSSLTSISFLPITGILDTVETTVNDSSIPITDSTVEPLFQSIVPSSDIESESVLHASTTSLAMTFINLSISEISDLHLTESAIYSVQTNIGVSDLAVASPSTLTYFAKETTALFTDIRFQLITESLDQISAITTDSIIEPSVTYVISTIDVESESVLNASTISSAMTFANFSISEISDMYLNDSSTYSLDSIDSMPNSTESAVTRRSSDIETTLVPYTQLSVATNQTSTEPTLIDATPVSITLSDTNENGTIIETLDIKSIFKHVTYKEFTQITKHAETATHQYTDVNATTLSLQTNIVIKDVIFASPSTATYFVKDITVLFTDIDIQLSTESLDQFSTMATDSMIEPSTTYVTPSTDVESVLNATTISSAITSAHASILHSSYMYLPDSSTYSLDYIDSTQSYLLLAASFSFTVPSESTALVSADHIDMTLNETTPPSTHYSQTLHDGILNTETIFPFAHVTNISNPTLASPTHRIITEKPKIKKKFEFIYVSCKTMEKGDNWILNFTTNAQHVLEKGCVDQALSVHLPDDVRLPTTSQMASSVSPRAPLQQILIGSIERETQLPDSIVTAMLNLTHVTGTLTTIKSAIAKDSSTKNSSDLNFVTTYEDITDKESQNSTPFTLQYISGTSSSTVTENPYTRVYATSSAKITSTHPSTTEIATTRQYKLVNETTSVPTLTSIFHTSTKYATNSSEKTSMPLSSVLMERISEHVDTTLTSCRPTQFLKIAKDTNQTYTESTLTDDTPTTYIEEITTKKPPSTNSLFNYSMENTHSMNNSTETLYGWNYTNVSATFIMETKNENDTHIISPIAESLKSEELIRLQTDTEKKTTPPAIRMLFASTKYPYGQTARDQIQLKPEIANSTNDIYSSNSTEITPTVSITYLFSDTTGYMDKPYETKIESTKPLVPSTSISSLRTTQPSRSRTAFSQMPVTRAGDRSTTALRTLLTTTARNFFLFTSSDLGLQVNIPTVLTIATNVTPTDQASPTTVQSTVTQSESSLDTIGNLNHLFVTEAVSNFPNESLKLSKIRHSVDLTSEDVYPNPRKEIFEYIRNENLTRGTAKLYFDRIKVTVVRSVSLAVDEGKRVVLQTYQKARDITTTVVVTTYTRAKELLETALNRIEALWTYCKTGIDHYIVKPLLNARVEVKYRFENAYDKLYKIFERGKTIIKRTEENVRQDTSTYFESLASYYTDVYRQYSTEVRDIFQSLKIPDDRE